MELINNFANLAENLSAKFPELKDTAPFYVLVFVALEFSSDNSYFSYFRSSFRDSSFNHIFQIIVPEIGKSNSVDVKSLSKKEFDEVCSYLIQMCLNIEAKNFPTSEKFGKIFDDLVLLEPNAIKETGLSESGTLYNVNWSNLSEKSLYRMVNSEFSDFSRNRKEMICTSKSLENFLVEIANPQPNQKIYNPICGISSLFLAFQRNFPNYSLECEGNEENLYLYLLGLVNRWINNLSWHDYFVKQGNPLDSFLADELPDEYNNYGKFDIAVTILPFGTHSRKNKPLTFEFFRKEGVMPNLETAYIELMLSITNEKGKVIVAVPESFLFSKESKLFREKYLLNDWVEKVISLPEDTFKPVSVKTSIIVFNKNKSKANKNFIIFDGKSEGFEETKVRTNLVESQNNADLRASRYALKESKEVESILSKYPQNEVKKIKDLIVSSISGYNYSPNGRVVENSSENLPYVRVTNLSKNDKDFTLDISKVERKISLENTRRKTIIDFSVVLVSKIAPKLKPTYFNFTGQPIFIGSDVIALKMKEDINVAYFLTQLHSRLVQIQVKMMSLGTTINRISTQDFLDIKIILPPLAEQILQIFERSGMIEEKAIAEEKLIDAQFDVVASINHSLKNKLAVIINDYDTLVRFLRRKERKIETIMFSDPISANAVGDDIDTIEIITNRLKTNLSDASKVFNNALKIQKQNLKKNVVELVKFFKEEVKPLYIGKNFSIEIIAKPNLKLNVWLDRDAFKDVIENLIENAKSHGFIDDEKNYRIIFDLSKLKDDESSDEHTSTKYARIVYKNDGKPFPKNFSFEDYKQFSNKSGKTQETGIGGYVINKIIDLHDGRFNFISPSDDFTVEFEILLPLEN